MDHGLQTISGRDLREITDLRDHALVRLHDEVVGLAAALRDELRRGEDCDIDT